MYEIVFGVIEGDILAVASLKLFVVLLCAADCSVCKVWVCLLLFLCWERERGMCVCVCVCVCEIAWLRCYDGSQLMLGTHIQHPPLAMIAQWQHHTDYWLITLFPADNVFIHVDAVMTNTQTQNSHGLEFFLRQGQAISNNTGSRDGNKQPGYCFAYNFRPVQRQHMRYCLLWRCFSLYLMFLMWCLIISTAISKV